MITENDYLLNGLNGCVSDNLKNVFNELRKRLGTNLFAIVEDKDIENLTREELSYIKRHFERMGFSFSLKVELIGNEFKHIMTISV